MPDHFERDKSLSQNGEYPQIMHLIIDATSIQKIKNPSYLHDLAVSLWDRLPQTQRTRLSAAATLTVPQDTTTRQLVIEAMLLARHLDDEIATSMALNELFAQQVIAPIDVEYQLAIDFPNGDDEV